MFSRLFGRRSPADTLAQARAVAANGDIGRAEQLFHDVLSREPASEAAIVGLSRLLINALRIDEAHTLLRAKFDADSANAPATVGLELGRLALRIGDIPNADSVSLKILEHYPTRFDAIELRVQCLLARSDVASAQHLARSWANTHADDASTQTLLSKVELAAGNSAAALDTARRAVEIDPSAAEGRYALACAELTAGNVQHAIDQFESLLADCPDHADAHYQLGHRLLTTSPIDGIYHLELCLRYDPLHANAMNALVRQMRAQNQHRAAIEHAEKLQSKLVFHYELFYILAVLYYETCDYEHSVALLRDILQRRPDSIDAMSQLGLGLRALGEFDEAFAVVQNAVQRAPDHHGARCNLALLKADRGNAQEAIADLTRQIQSYPNDSIVRWDRAVLLLSTGDFSHGWDDYELRWIAPGAETLPALYPTWHGQSASDSTLVVLGEQGVGDEIMFASCLSNLRGRFARVVIACNPKLVPLFQRSFGEFADVVSRVNVPHALAGLSPPTEKAGGTVLQIAMGSLPGLFRRDAAAFPRTSGFLRADGAKIERWRNELEAHGPGLNIGLSWRGGAALTRKSQRSLDLKNLAHLTSFLGARFINLQYNATADEITTLKRDHGIDLIHFDDALADYDETAALTCAVDVVVTVQTALAHLAGALGQRVLVMLPFSPEWRYLRTGSTWPWYPSATLLRQKAPGVWHDVIDDVHTKLNSLQP